MRNKLIFAALSIMLCANSAFGQTASDIDTKYGKSAKVYSVSEHIWMTPEYTADGQVCLIRLYPKRISATANYFFKELPFEELKGVLNQLAPLDTRGVKKESFGMSATGGGFVWTTYPYEKVKFIFTSSFKVDPNAWKESKPYVFTVQDFPSDEKTENSAPSDDDFLSSKASSAEIVTMIWNDRKCAGK
jgi:hypothetical protein